jgi:hypothetical protein
VVVGEIEITPLGEYIQSLEVSKIRVENEKNVYKFWLSIINRYYLLFWKFFSFSPLIFETSE